MCGTVVKAMGGSSATNQAHPARFDPTEWSASKTCMMSNE